jgi:DNA-binding CsgD family transcriptional regulator
MRSTVLRIQNRYKLTRRQAVVLNEALNHTSHRKCAMKLKITHKTCRVHMHHIYLKLGVNNRFALYKKYLEIKERSRKLQ